MKQMNRESERKRLVELCENIILSCKANQCADCEHNKIDYPQCMSEHFADRILANYLEDEEPTSHCEYAAVVPTTGVILCNWFFENVKDSDDRPFCHFPLCSMENCKLK